MKNMRKTFYLVAMSLLGIVFTSAQTNLIKNGDFKNGEEGWELSNFKLTTEDGYQCVVSPNISAANLMSMIPSIETNQEITLEPEKTYIFSFLVKGGLSYRDVNASLTLYDSNGAYIEYIEEIDDFYYDTTSMEFTEGIDKGNGWVQIRREIKFPQETNIAKMAGYRLSLVAVMGDGKRNMRITNISIAEKVNYVAPKNFKVADDMLFQRGANLTWEAVDGKNYKVEVNDKVYDAKGNSVYVQGLLPATKYTAVVYAESVPEKKSTLEFTTKGMIQEKEENAVPFLDNIKNGQLPKNFIPNIQELAGGKIMKLEINYNNVPAEISEDGVVTLPNFDEGKLDVKITQDNNEETVLTYNSITLKK